MNLLGFKLMTEKSPNIPEVEGMPNESKILERCPGGSMAMREGGGREGGRGVD